MTRWIGAGLVIVCGLGGSAGRGQVIERERDVTVTGPRGRSLTRSIQTERGPGFIDRQVKIQRPGGTFSSNTMIQRGMHPVGPRPFVGGGGFGPRWGGGFGPRPFVVERNVVVNPGIGLGPALLGGAGLFGLGMFAGSAMSAPVAVPAYPVAPVPPPNVVIAQPQPYSVTPPPPATVVIDPVAEAAKRLQSYHNHSRRDGAITLGRLRDPRAIPALVDRLKNDNSTEVRVAAATALGEIGDPQAAVYLERANVYDKKQAVRDAATAALTRLPRGVPTVTATVPPASSANPDAAAVPSLAPIETVPPPPTPEPPLNRPMP